jgi:hypothetical protein
MESSSTLCTCLLPSARILAIAVSGPHHICSHFPAVAFFSPPWLVAFFCPAPALSRSPRHSSSCRRAPLPLHRNLQSPNAFLSFSISHCAIFHHGYRRQSKCPPQLLLAAWNGGIKSMMLTCWTLVSTDHAAVAGRACPGVHLQLHQPPQ